MVQHNKIFFETLAAVFLTIMSIIVGIAQWSSANSQNKIAEIQKELAEAQALPSFEIKIEQFKDQQSGMYNRNDLIILNHGGPAYNFEAESAYFIKTTYADPTVSCELRVPLDGYFAADFEGSGSTGQLVQMYGDKNNLMYSELTNEPIELNKNNSYALNLQQELYLKLSYTDLLNRSHMEYYQVHAVRGGKRIDDKTGEPILKHWEEAAPRESLNNVHATTLLHECMTAMKTRSQN